MGTNLSELLDLSITIEHACAGVYEVFARAFEADDLLCAFWGTYAEAERYHAAMIALHRAAFLSEVDASSLSFDAADARAFLEQLHGWQERCTAAPPTPADAFSIAESIEAHTAELHGRKQFYERAPRFADLFQRMTEEDEEHRRVLADARARYAAA